MTHSAAQQVLLQRLGIATLQLHPQFGSVSAFEASAIDAAPTMDMADMAELPAGQLLIDLQLALQSVASQLQPRTLSSTKQAFVAEPHIILPWPLTAADKRQLWQLLSSLDPS